MRIPELYQVDTAMWTVTIAINLHLFWTDSTLIGKTVSVIFKFQIIRINLIISQEDEIDWETVWKPDLEILNAFEVTEESVFELLVCYAVVCQ